MNFCRCGCGTPTNGKWARGHHWSAKHEILAPPNPSGLCMCGCGRKTAIAKVTIYAQQVLKGHPLRYVRTHGNSQYRKLEDPNPSGLCFCGCGRTTSIAKETDTTAGHVMGKHVRFIHNHHCRPAKPRYIVKECGYKTPCWVWNWSVDKNGYGQVSFQGNATKAHIASYKTTKGAIPKGYEVDHLCFNPPCINPDHLEAVTRQVNQDRRRYIKLSPEKIPVIRQLAAWGSGYADIGKLFGVTAPAIWAALNNKTWGPERYKTSKPPR